MLVRGTSMYDHGSAQMEPTQLRIANYVARATKQPSHFILRLPTSSLWIRITKAADFF